MSITFTTVPAKSLYQPLLSTDTTFKLADITGFNGNNLTASDFGTVGYGVLLNSDRSVMELFSWDPTTIASTSISFVSRGLPFTGSGASVTAYKLDWPAGSTVLLGSDTPQFIQWLKDYIDGIAIAGSPNASTVLQGLVQESNQAQRDAGTTTGSTGARLFSNPSTERGKLINDYAVDASGTDAYAITITPAITAYAAGQRFTFKAGTANTGACTLNVSGLGAKTIKKDVSSDLATGDILANQIVEVEYDGTNMQLLSKVSGATALASDIQTFTSNGTWTKPTLGTPKKVHIQLWGGGGGGGGVGTSAGSNESCGGGGGGSYNEIIVSASQLPATVAVTIGAGGAGGIGVGATGAIGATGGTSTFGSYLSAYGGAGGGWVNGTGAGGGGGGGAMEAGTAASGATGGAGGGPNGGAASSIAYAGGGGGGSTGAAGGATQFGGSGGGSSGLNGGTSVMGGGGGGGGDSAPQSGGGTIGSGGVSQFGGTGGTGGSNANGNPGTAPGGGGGGSSDNTNARTGGAGAAGQCIITTFF